MPDILILPQRGTTTNPSIQFTGSAAAPIRLEVLESGSLSFVSTSGSLFTVVDATTGSLHAVSDISGMPILEVFSDDRVVMGKFNANALVVTGSNVGVGTASPTHPLHVYRSSESTIAIETTGRKWGIVTNTAWANNGFNIYDLTGDTSRFFVSTTGRVGIGTISPNATLDVNGNTVITGSAAITVSLGVGVTASGTGGEIRATGEIISSYSDDRLKTRLGIIDNAIGKIKTLSGFYYAPSDMAIALGYPKKIDVGISAQEVKEVLPEVVTPAPIDPQYMTVRYERLIPLLIEAIKEQQSQIESLTKKVEELSKKD